MHHGSYAFSSLLTMHDNAGIIIKTGRVNVLPYFCMVMS